MKIRFLKSISAKLFYYTAILVSAVIFAVSFQNSKSYQQMLLRTFQDSSLDRGENIRITLENFFSSVDSQLKITLATMLSVNQVQKETTAFNFLENNKRKFVSLQVFRQTLKKKAVSTLFQFTSDINSPAFESKDPKRIAKKIKSWNRIWLNRSLAKNPGEKIYLKSFASRIKLPVISYAKKYENGRTGQTYWAVLTIWQEPFFSLLDSTNDSEITIVDSEGRIFSSKDIDSLKKGITLKRTKLYKKANADVQGLGSAFIGSYKGRKGIRWLGSYQKIDSLGLIVFMEKNEDALSRDIDALVIRTAKWGLLFVLIALAFSAIGSTTITRNLKNVVNITQMIARGDFSARIRPSSDDEIGYLALSVNSMADRIGHLLTEKVEKARFEKELETANAVQNTLFPKKGLENDSLEVVGFSKPASECGGDWWGYFEHDNGKTFILIADAMGHGVPAALVTAMAYANCMSLQAIAKDAQLQSEMSPKNFLERFNKVLFDAVEGSITMSFFALLVDTEAATVTFANAGHNFPVLLPKDPDDPRISRKSKKLQKISPITPIALKESGSILGIDRDAEFHETTMPIAEGDKIFLFTDGLIECTSEDNKAWGRKGLINHLLTYCDRGAVGLRDSIHKEAYEFYGKQPPIDDITMVVTEIKEVNTKPQPAPEREQREQAVAPVPRAAQATAPSEPPASPAPRVAPAAVAPPETPAVAAPNTAAPGVPPLPPPVAIAKHEPIAEPTQGYTEQRAPLSTPEGGQTLEETNFEETNFEETKSDEEDQKSYQISEEPETIQVSESAAGICLDLGDVTLTLDDIDLGLVDPGKELNLSEALDENPSAEESTLAPAGSKMLKASIETAKQGMPPILQAEPAQPKAEKDKLESTDKKIKVSASNYLQTVDDPNKAFPGKRLDDGTEQYDRHMPSRMATEEFTAEQAQSSGLGSEPNSDHSGEHSGEHGSDHSGEHGGEYGSDADAGDFAETKQHAEDELSATDAKLAELITHVDDIVDDDDAKTVRISDLAAADGGAIDELSDDEDDNDDGSGGDTPSGMAS